MGKVIIETQDHQELEIRTFLTSQQIQNLIREKEKKERAKELIKSTFGTLKENKELECQSELEWYEQ